MNTEESTTKPLNAGERQQVSDALQAIADNRAVIEQAKGMLMFVCGVDADKAFELLRSQSQQNNVKLRRLAQQVVTDLVEQSKVTAKLDRLDAHDVLLEAPRRISDGPAPSDDQ
jgi:hypothetical protein